MAEIRPPERPDLPESSAGAGRGSTAMPPPADYWAALEGRLPGAPVEDLRRKFDQGWYEFRPSDLRPPEPAARKLLETVAEDGWLAKDVRRSCPNADCGRALEESEAVGVTCPGCGSAFQDFDGGVVVDEVFVREAPQSRDVSWVLALHGMNTRGDWQEEFNWKIATTWPHTVPVAIYKYGKVLVGVILSFRRKALQRRLAERIRRLSGEARSLGFTGKPDVIAHSFGTWLLGHLLRDDLSRERRAAEEPGSSPPPGAAGERDEPRLEFGRVILTGCILKPDFEWEPLVENGRVEAVLNHFGTRDGWAGIAHYAIPDSGPSGRRGFDTPGVINVRAEGFAHSRYFLPGTFGTVYDRVWRPFLRLPEERFTELPDRHQPAEKWKPALWPLRATLSTVFALLLLLGAVAPVAAFAGWLASGAVTWGARLALAGLAGLVLVAVGVVAESLVRAIGRRLRS